MKVRLIVSDLRQYYIHKITLDGIRDLEHAYSLVHPTGYYTLNNIPEGPKLSLSEVDAYHSSKSETVTAKLGTSKISYEAIKPLLIKYTCASCHNPEKRQVGPGFIDVAKRNYSIEKILALIKNPEPSNWPDYATPMAAMPQVPDADARKIAAWINSLASKK